MRRALTPTRYQGARQLDRRQGIFYHGLPDHSTVRCQRFNTDTSRLFVNGQRPDGVGQAIVRAVAKQAVEVVLRQGKADVVAEIDLTVFSGEVVVATIIGNEIAIRKGFHDGLFCPTGTTQARNVFARNVLERALEIGATQVVQWNDRHSVIRRRLGLFRLGRTFGRIASTVVGNRTMMNGQPLHRVAITVAERLTESHGMDVIVRIARRYTETIRVVKMTRVVVTMFLAAPHDERAAVAGRRLAAKRGRSMDDLRRREDCHSEHDSDNGTGKQHDDGDDDDDMMVVLVRGFYS